MWSVDANTASSQHSDVRTLPAVSDTSTTYLALVEDGTIAVEQLERREDVTLYQDSSQDRRCCPPPCAYWHLEKPLFQGQLTHRSIAAAAQHCSHVGCCSDVRWAQGCVGLCASPGCHVEEFDAANCTGGRYVEYGCKRLWLCLGSFVRRR